MSDKFSAGEAAADELVDGVEECFGQVAFLPFPTMHWRRPCCVYFKAKKRDKEDVSNLWCEKIDQ